MIGLPIGAFLAALYHPIFVPFAGGMPVGICLLLLWLSHEFISPQLVVDFGERTITKSKPYGRGMYSSIDVEDIDQVSIVPIGRTALVNLQYKTFELSKPYATAIDTGNVHDFTIQLEQLGVSVHIRESATPLLSLNVIRGRLIGTPVVIVGSTVAIWHQFGCSAFWTDAVVVPMIVIVLFALYSFYRRHFQNSSETR